MKTFKEYIINRDMEMPKSKNSFSRNQMDKLVPTPVEREYFNKFNIRWLIRRDIKDILEIDNTITKEELENYLKEENTVGLVCEGSNGNFENNKVIGFVIFKNIPNRENVEGLEIIKIKYLLKYEDSFFNNLMPKIIGKLNDRINKINIVDDENNHPSFYAQLKRYGFVGQKTNLGWQFSYEKIKK